MSSPTLNFTDPRMAGPLVAGETEHIIGRWLIPKSPVGVSKISVDVIDGETQEIKYSGFDLDGPTVLPGGTVILYQACAPSTLALGALETAVRFFIRTSAVVGKGQRLFVRLSSNNLNFMDRTPWGPLVEGESDHVIPRHVMLKGLAGPSKMTIEVFDDATKSVLYAGANLD
eukprot:Platyproteum_vivax@DN13458_c0_g1_i1.p1